MTYQQRLVLFVYLGSFVIFGAYPTFRVHNLSRVVAEQATDHASHWGSAILLATHGFDIYRVPSSELCAPTTGEDSKIINCALKDHPSIRPFTVNWTQYPRVYPPGAMLFGTLPALLHVTTSMGFSDINLVMILQIVIMAHLTSLALLMSLWRSVKATESLPSEWHSGWQSFVLFAVMPFIHLELVGNAILGFYDPVAIALVVVGLLELNARRPVRAVLAFSAALFFHFRALWYLPLLLVAFVKVYRRRAEWKSSRRTWLLLGVAAALLAVSAFCFILLMPALQTFPISNPLHYSQFTADAERLLRYGLPPALFLTVLARQKNWLTAGVVVWQLAFVFVTRETQPWHCLFVLPVLATAAIEKRAAPIAVATTFVLFIWESWQLFLAWPLTGDRLADLL
jgi:hypothetical protein